VASPARLRDAAQWLTHACRKDTIEAARAAQCASPWTSSRAPGVRRSDTLASTDESAHPTDASVPEGAANERHPSASETTAHHDSDGDVPGVEAVSAGVPAEDAPASAPRVADGPAARPHKEPPNVAQAKPERGLSDLRGVRPDQL
jgi:hypothetical protein